MKVLMVTTWYSPKDSEVMFAGVFHYEQAMALKPYCETALYYPFDTDLEENFSKKEEKGLLTYRRRKAKRSIPKISVLLQILRGVCDLKKICKEFKPDIIHAHCAGGAGRIAVLYGRLFGCPVVITEHSPIEQLNLQKPNNRSNLGRTYKNSSANICVSKDSMNRLKEYFPKAEYKVIYNGIYSPETVGVDGEKYRIDGRVNACIVAGFYSKEIKGYQYLLPAVLRLKEKGVLLTLHIVGGGEYFDYYKNMADELGISDCCIFYGNCTKEKVYSIVSQMDFNISASLFECSGVSVEEALLIGKPMLVTKSGGANSLVTDDVAIVVDRGSTEALVDGVEQMIQRLPAFDAEEIKEYAFYNFEIDQVSQQYMRLYEQLLENKK